MKNKNKLSAFARKGKFLATVATASALGAVAASAQTANEGVDAIVTAINGLKPDMAGVVVAGIGLALIGVGALAAYALFRRIAAK